MTIEDMENAIISTAIDAILSASCKISVFDGEEYPVKRSSDKDEIVKALRSTGEDTLVIRDSDGVKIGVVYFIYGNDGHDVIADYTALPVIEDMLKPATDLADKIMREQVAFAA